MATKKKKQSKDNLNILEPHVTQEVDEDNTSTTNLSITKRTNKKTHLKTYSGC